MNYEIEFNRLLDTVNQYLKNTESRASLTVLQNAANFYNDIPAKETVANLYMFTLHKIGGKFINDYKFIYVIGMDYHKVLSRVLKYCDIHNFELISDIILTDCNCELIINNNVFR